jgi:hypothetical protein
LAINSLQLRPRRFKITRRAAVGAEASTLAAATVWAGSLGNSGDVIVAVAPRVARTLNTDPATQTHIVNRNCTIARRE